jgi:hypothetical protein
VSEPEDELAQLPEVRLGTGQPVEDATDEELNTFVDNYKDVQFKLASNSGITVMKVGDVRYNTATRRWQNLRSGHFVSKPTLITIKNSLSRPHTNLARAFKVATVDPLPRNYEEATTSNESLYWIEAMNDEMNSLIENDVFEIIPASEATKKPVGSRWVFTVKFNKNGAVEKYKARVVAKGYTQRYGDDYDETYCTVVHILTTRLVLNYATAKGMFMKQFDIKTAFLYGSLNEMIYLEPPDGYKQEGKVWRLKRSLYGLKQSPRMWNTRFNDFMKTIGLSQSNYDASVFYRTDPYAIVLVYVDDGLVVSNDMTWIDMFMAKLQIEFKVRILDLDHYRGLEIMKTADGIFLHQSRYVQRVLDQFQMGDSRPARTPYIELDPSGDVPLNSRVPYRSAIGCLAYLADTTRPDIAFVVNKLSRKTTCPTQNDWKCVKQVLRYLNGTQSAGIKFSKTLTNPNLIGFSDSDFAGDASSSKSTTGYVLLFNASCFHWKAQLQRHVTLSSTEAEVVALCALSKEMAWIRRMMIELKMIMRDEPAQLYCDNRSAIFISISERATRRTRHLRAQDAYIRELVELNELRVNYVKADDQLADLLTKSIGPKKFITDRDKLLTLR